MEAGSRKNTSSAQKNSTDDVSETASDTNSQTRYYDAITIEKDYLTKIYETINPPSKPTGYENVGNNPDKYQQVTYRKLEIIKSLQDGDITGGYQTHNFTFVHDITPQLWKDMKIWNKWHFFCIERQIMGKTGFKNNNLSNWAKWSQISSNEYTKFCDYYEFSRIYIKKK